MSYIGELDVLEVVVLLVAKFEHPVAEDSGLFDRTPRIVDAMQDEQFGLEILDKVDGATVLPQSFIFLWIAH